MQLIEVIRNLMAQEIPNATALEKVIVEVNKYLPDDKKFDLNNPPSIVSLLSFTTLLPDQTKFTLYTTEMDLTDIGLSEVTLPPDKRDNGAKLVVGALAVLISLAAMFVENGQLTWEDVKALVVFFMSLQ